MNSVNRIRLRSSGILPMFKNEEAATELLGGGGPWGGRRSARDDLESTARALDLLARGGRGAVRLDHELLGQLALAENLDVLGELANQTLGAQRVEIDRRAGVEFLVEGGDVDRHGDGHALAIRVLEPALGDAPRHRHLATLERVPRPVVTRAGLLALHALTGRLALARAATAAETLLLPGGAGVGVEIVQRDRHRH